MQCFHVLVSLDDVPLQSSGKQVFVNSLIIL
jgi:hypothetical protein